jgi:hypothetical protein
MGNPLVHFFWHNKAVGVLGAVSYIPVVSINFWRSGKLMGLGHLGRERRASQTIRLIQLLYPSTALADLTDFQ